MGKTWWWWRIAANYDDYAIQGRIVLYVPLVLVGAVAALEILVVDVVWARLRRINS